MITAMQILRLDADNGELRTKDTNQIVHDALPKLDQVTQ